MSSEHDKWQLLQQERHGSTVAAAVGVSGAAEASQGYTTLKQVMEVLSRIVRRRHSHSFKASNMCEAIAGILTRAVADTTGIQVIEAMRRIVPAASEAADNAIFDHRLLHELVLSLLSSLLCAEARHRWLAIDLEEERAVVERLKWTTHELGTGNSVDERIMATAELLRLSIPPAVQAQAAQMPSLMAYFSQHGGCWWDLDLSVSTVVGGVALLYAT